MKSGSFRDLPARKDLFGIAPYIKGLAEFIAHCETPMTVAIQGDWGAGKTSVMTMARTYLTEQESDNGALLVWFNTWQYSQFNMDSGLGASLINAIINELDIGIDKEAIGKSIKTIIGYVAASAVSKGADVIGAGGAGAGIYSAIKAAFFGPDNNENPANAVKNLKSRFKEYVQKALKKAGKNRLVVFIDDLDRLKPQKAVELLEILKNYLDCENCVFVLAVDANVVYQGLRSKYGSDFSDEKAESFFDKIIQLSIKIPVDNYNVANYVKSALASLEIRTDERELAALTSLVCLCTGKNPRSIKRLFNSYCWHASTVTAADGNERNFTQKETRLVFALVCMASKFLYINNVLESRANDLDEEFLRRFCDAKDAIYSIKNSDGEEILSQSDKNAAAAFMREFVKFVEDTKSLEELKKMLAYSSALSLSY